MMNTIFPGNQQPERDVLLASRMRHSAQQVQVALAPGEWVRTEAERRQQTRRVLSSVAGAAAVALIAGAVWTTGSLSRLGGPAPAPPAGAVSTPATSATRATSVPGPAAETFVMADYESAPQVLALAEAGNPDWRNSAVQKVIDGGGIYRVNPPGTPADAPKRRLDWLPVPCGVKQKFNVDFFVNQGLERQSTTSSDGTEARVLLQMQNAGVAERLVTAVTASASACAPDNPASK
ncbi:MAG: hypothetical protein ACRC0L_01625, partial [Angustibacter sp.]